MLKRPRPLTPPPLPSDLAPESIPHRQVHPLPQRNSNNIFEDRQFKRRRVKPPVLDGTMRGWAADEPSTSSSMGPQDSDGEEPWTDDDESQQPPAQPADSSEYRKANSVLHEIHALHQHRLLFVNPPSTPGPSTCASSVPRPQPPLPYQLPHTTEQFYPHAFLSVDKPNGFNHAPARAVYPSRSETHPHLQVDSVQPPSAGSGQEVQLVKERYEDTNRLLGSLFLSRRRELFPLDYGPLDAPLGL